MDALEAAEKLNGCQYREEGSRELFKAMEAAGLVAVFGASDDLAEFRGAVDDEIGAYEGASIAVTADGLPENDCRERDCPYYIKTLENAKKIDVKWDVNGYSWYIETEIPHVPFTVYEDEETYCRGIVFKLSDAA